MSFYLLILQVRFIKESDAQAVNMWNCEVYTNQIFFGSRRHDQSLLNFVKKDDAYKQKLKYGRYVCS